VIDLIYVNTVDIVITKNDEVIITITYIQSEGLSLGTLEEVTN
jgi:hypothetical protein